MTSRKQMVLGNWKMNLGIEEAQKLAQQISAGLNENTPREAMVCPPLTHLHAVSQVTSETPLRLGAQNTFYEYEGPYTGEVSSPMLKELGVEAVIIGHSERRVILGESEEDIRKKVDAVVEQGLEAVICVGEPEQVRSAGKQREFVENQLRSALENVTVENVEPCIVVAYEPIWAIGTGNSATPDQAQEMHSYIRELLNTKYGHAGDMVPLLYGGSVNPENAKQLFAEADIDGALVGGASLNAESFLAIVNA